jgi:acyl-ACP thioesterase
MFEKQFQLRYSDMNKYGEASPVTILALLEEAASEHCSHIGYGLDYLYSQNIGWVLLAACIEMNRYPVFRERITIRTWMSQYTTTRGYRENIIYDEEGKIIGSGRCLWLFYDIKRKRPVKIFDEIKTKWSAYKPESDYDIDGKINAPGTFARQKQLHVCNYDMDMNNHVNNLRYLQWLLETVPDDVTQDCYVSLVDIRFLKEAYNGHTIESCTVAAQKNYFAHAINNLTDGSACAIGTSIWKKRSSIASLTTKLNNSTENNSLLFRQESLIK